MLNSLKKIILTVSAICIAVSCLMGLTAFAADNGTRLQPTTDASHGTAAGTADEPVLIASLDDIPDGYDSRGSDVSYEIIIP